jgi:hypothetical protein
MEEGKKPLKRRSIGQGRPRPVRLRKKSWFEKNMKTLLIVFVVLFLGQSIRGCVNTSSLERKVRNNTAVNDSISAIDRQN